MDIIRAYEKDHFLTQGFKKAIAYAHGIYRDEKNSCYKVIAVFGHDKALFGEKIILR